MHDAGVGNSGGAFCALLLRIRYAFSNILHRLHRSISTSSPVALGSYLPSAILSASSLYLPQLLFFLLPYSHTLRIVITYHSYVHIGLFYTLLSSYIVTPFPLPLAFSCV